MLRVYGEYLSVLREMKNVMAAIERRDVDLARQLRRAAASVALNVAEGSGNAGGTRRQRYLSALGSANEVVACLEVGEALGYVTLDEGLLGKLRRVAGVLGRLVR